MEWTNEVIIEFLDLYKAEPAIWNPQNENHSDRNQVYDAWKRIQTQISIQCSLKALKRKKENLMSTFRKLSKVQKSSTTGSGSDVGYKPEWFAYDKMASFLDTVHAARGTTTPEIPKNDDTFDEVDSEEDTCAPINNEGDSSPATGPNHSDSNVTEPKGPPLWKKRKANNTHIETSLDQAYNFLQEVATKPKNEKDEIQLFCDLLSTKLKALDETNRDIVMYDIDMMLFDAKDTSLQPNAILIQYLSPQSPNCNQLGITPKQRTELDAERPAKRGKLEPLGCSSCCTQDAEEDKQFLLSLLSHMQYVPRPSKLALRSEIIQLIAKYIPSPSTNH